VTVKVEKAPEDVYSYKQQTVVVDGGEAEVIHLDKEQDPFVVIVPIALSVIVVLIAAVACRYCMNRSTKDLLEAERRVQRAKDFKVTPTAGFEDVLGEKELAELRQMKVKLGDDLGKGKQNYRGV
jgi:protein-disulfide isomerase